MLSLKMISVNNSIIDINIKEINIECGHPPMCADDILDGTMKRDCLQAIFLYGKCITALHMLNIDWK